MSTNIRRENFTELYATRMGHNPPGENPPSTLGHNPTAVCLQCSVTVAKSQHIYLWSNT